MTTKNFNQMTTKKLNALLMTASDEDKAAIEAVLAAREQVQIPAEASAEAPADEEDTPLTPEEEAAIKAAEENGGFNPLYNGSKASQEKKAKMTDDERHALAEELRKNIFHRCQAVPFNTVEWVSGYIAGVIEDKRNSKVLYAIKTDDGRRIVKVHNSNLIKIFDETVTPERKVRVRVEKPQVEKIKWTQEIVNNEVNKYIGNVGRIVRFEKYRTIDDNGEEYSEMAIGRITTIVPDRRAQTLLYGISVLTPTEDNPNATKVIHKVVTSSAIAIDENIDAEGEQINARYIARREIRLARTAATPQGRVVRCEEDVKELEEKMRGLQDKLEAKKKQLEDAKKELDEYLANQMPKDTSVEESLA